MEKQYTRDTLLITVAQLQNKLGSANLCIIDTRPAEDYAKGHGANIAINGGQHMQ